MSRTIVVDNITAADARKNQIRILVANKYLFPLETPKMNNVYELTFRYQGNDYQVNYSIGAWDGRTRSGVLRLGIELYQKLSIIEGSRVSITKEVDGVYSIKTL